MGFKRFLIWLFEKLVELHLGVVALLLVKFFMPVTPEAYQSIDAFFRGVQDTFAAASDDASFVAGNFLGDSALTYALNAYVASLFVIGFYVYVSSLYVLLSLLAVALSRHGGYMRNAAIAYVLAFALFCARFIHVYDTSNLYAGGALFVLGMMAVLASAAIGRRLSGGAAKPSVQGRIRLDFSH